MSDNSDVRDVDKSIQGREARMVHNPYLRSILSQGHNHRHIMNFQIGDSISSNSVINNRLEKHFSIPHDGHAVYDRNLISGFHADRGIIPYHSYLQQRDTQSVGDVTLSVPILRCHRYDDHQDRNNIRRRVVERIINFTLLRLLSLESQLSTDLRQQANVDTLRFSTVGLSVLEQNAFSDLTLSPDSLDCLHSAQLERLIHMIR